MRALILAPFSHSALERLEEYIPLDYEPWTETRKLYDPYELAARINEEAVGILVIEADFLFEEAFQESRSLALVGVCRAAIDHVDMDAATGKGVLVINSPSRNAGAVAELTLGLMLSLTRHIPEAHTYVKDGRWEDPVEPYVRMRGIELGGKTLGIVGLGAIGKRVARIGRAIGMRVLAYDPYVGRRPGVILVPLEHLLRESDFVTLHASAVPETQGLLNSDNFSLMKPSAYLINTASSSLVAEEALVAALRDGKIAGAALDVFETHPVVASSPLLSLNNVLFTPHIGGATQETIERYSSSIAEDIILFVTGRRPKRLVNPGAWKCHGR